MTETFDPIKVRFIGSKINNENGVPIYELAEALTAIQRLVYRAYLEHEDLRQQNIREPSIRRELALQIQSRERGSDIYNLAAFVQSPGGSIAMSVFTALFTEISLMGARYIKDKVVKDMGRRKKLKEGLEVEGIYRPPKPLGDDDEQKRYILDNQAISYYNEFKGLGNPVGRKRGVDRIEITFPNESKPLTITPEFRKNIARLENFYYFGEPTSFPGVVDRANVYDKNGATIRIVRRLKRKTKHGMYSITNRKVFVRIADTDLFDDLIAVVADNNRPLLSFHGRPIHRVGDIGVSFKEFKLENFDFVLRKKGNRRKKGR